MLWEYLTSLALLVSAVQARACYSPSGENINRMYNTSDEWLYAPCSNVEEVHSMCCAIGDGRGNTKDTCIDGGLCRNGDLIWRESCTDPTWQDPACVKLFVNGTGYQNSAQDLDDSGQPLTDVMVTSCDNGSFCYGDGNRNCCRQNQGVFVNAIGEQTDVNPNLAQVNTSSTTSTTPTSTPTSTLATSNSSNGEGDGLSTGAKTGIGVGVGVGVLIILAILAFFFVTKRRRRPTDDFQPTGTSYYEPVPRIAEKHAQSDKRRSSAYELGSGYRDRQSLQALPGNQAVEMA